MMLMDKAQKGPKKQVGGICSSGATSCIGVLRCVRDALIDDHTCICVLQHRSLDWWVP